MKASIEMVETFGLVDGPGIRTVIFFNGCKLRCKYCHNPEMWIKGKENMTVDEVVQKVIKNKPYFKRNNGGVTFSGGEPLLQVDFLIELSKKLKKEGIHIALDTAGVGIGKYDELLKYIDLVLLDIKHISDTGFKDLTGCNLSETYEFINALNKSGKPVWIRQVIVPGIMDNIEYLNHLNDYLKGINNIERIDFLPYHKLGGEKYQKLGILNPYKDMVEMDRDKCCELYNLFVNEIYIKV